LIGCGDVALRAAHMMRDRAKIIGVVRRAEDVPRLRSHDIVPVVADLDDFTSLRRLSLAPFAVLHCAPPPSEGRDDPRTQKLVAALTRARIIPQRFVYISTSGVYGDCVGARVDETRPRKPQTPRARRRAAAEDRLRAWSARNGVALAILRAPGIYSDARLPLERLKQGTPVLAPDDDVFTNHIHADDLARACVAALHRGLPQRAVNVSDDSEIKMGDYFDLAADLCRLPRPPRIARAEAEQHLSPMALSFMSESRRLVNTRLVRELRVRLRYPRVHDGLLAGLADSGSHDDAA